MLPVTITGTGTGFVWATAVQFSASQAASFTIDSDVQIAAVIPAHAKGRTNIFVRTPAGRSAAGPGYTLT